MFLSRFTTGVRRPTSHVMITNKFRFALVICFWVLVITWYVRWQVRQRRRVSNRMPEDVQWKRLGEDLTREFWAASADEELAQRVEDYVATRPGGAGRTGVKMLKCYKGRRREFKPRNMGTNDAKWEPLINTEAHGAGLVNHNHGRSGEFNHG
jgi:hypothetical protein